MLAYLWLVFTGSLLLAKVHLQLITGFGLLVAIVFGSPELTTGFGALVAYYWLWSI